MDDQPNIVDIGERIEAKACLGESPVPVLRGSMTNVLTQLARQEERLNAIEQQITLLRQSEGFMLPLRRRAHEAPR